MTVFCFQRDCQPPSLHLRYEFALDIGYDIYRYRIGLMVCKLDGQSEIARYRLDTRSSSIEGVPLLDATFSDVCQSALTGPQ